MHCFSRQKKQNRKTVQKVKNDGGGRIYYGCNGQIVGQPRKRKVDKMSEKCRKNVRKMSKNCPEGLKTQFSDIFRTIFFAYLLDASIW